MSQPSSEAAHFLWIQTVGGQWLYCAALTCGSVPVVIGGKRAKVFLLQMAGRHVLPFKVEYALCFLDGDC